MRVAALLCCLCCTTSATAQTTADFKAPHQRQAYELLKQSVEYKTVRGEGVVPEFAEFMAQQFLDGGFDARDVRLMPMVSDGEPSAAIVVTYRGDTNQKPIVFTAHMDVVGAAPADWAFDPFVLNEAEGFYYGRGVLDDKFGTTMITSTFIRLKQEGFVPERDLVAVLTGDEETVQFTAKTLVEDYRELMDAEVVFTIDVGAGFLDENGVPVATLLQFSEKSYLTVEVSATNRGGHSSAPRADNAIYDVADAIDRIRNYTFPTRTNEGVEAYFRALRWQVGDEAGRAIDRFLRDPEDAEALEVLSNYPDLIGAVRTTCVPTLLSGGHAENALPEIATVTIQCRVFPGILPEVVEDQLRAVIDNPSIQLTRKWNPVIAPASPIRQDVVRIIERNTERFYPSIPVVPFPASFGTDSVYFRQAGMTAYGLMGLYMHPEDVLLHASGEKLPVRGFFDALEFWYDFMIDVSSL